MRFDGELPVRRDRRTDAVAEPAGSEVGQDGRERAAVVRAEDVGDRLAWWCSAELRELVADVGER